MVCTLVLSACSVQTNNEPDLSAVPHAAALPTTELSKEDKTKLLEASGKTVAEISIVDLQNMIAASDEKLHIYAFWNKDCSKCFENIDYLNGIYANMQSEKVRIITLNVDDKIQDVNLSVRSNNIAFETYKLNVSDGSWVKLLDENWDGQLPALFMVNKSEDLYLKYYNAMDQNQLEAIIQTLII